MAAERQQGQERLTESFRTEGDTEVILALFAREGLERAARPLGLDLVARFSLCDPPAKIAATRCEAILARGPLKREIELWLASRAPPRRAPRRRFSWPRRLSFSARVLERARRAR